MIKTRIVFDRHALEKQVANEVLKEVNDISNLILYELKLQTPVDTGEARASWTKHMEKDKLVLENDENYIFYVNSGTSRIAPRNFIERVCLQFGKAAGPVALLK
jgi:hypothetical protein